MLVKLGILGTIGIKGMIGDVVRLASLFLGLFPGEVDGDVTYLFANTYVTEDLLRTPEMAYGNTDPM